MSNYNNDLIIDLQNEVTKLSAAKQELADKLLEASKELQAFCKDYDDYEFLHLYEGYENLAVVNGANTDGQ